MEFCHRAHSHIIHVFQICAGTLRVLAQLPDYYEEMRRWGKNFKNGKSCDDQTPGDMQRKLQKKVTLLSQSSYLCCSTGAIFSICNCSCVCPDSKKSEVFRFRHVASFTYSLPCHYARTLSASVPDMTLGRQDDIKLQKRRSSKTVSAQFPTTLHSLE